MVKDLGGEMGEVGGGGRVCYGRPQIQVPVAWDKMYIEYINVFLSIRQKFRSFINFLDGRGVRSCIISFKCEKYLVAFRRVH